MDINKYFIYLFTPIFLIKHVITCYFN
uniref:Uncharacterized protein n=1 Tax=Heterorhabditis bacteriophora TaxID=37862 RepID=A0A1I7WE76_HETBA